MLEREKPKIVMSGDNYSFVLLNLIKPFFTYKVIFVLRVGNKLDKLINSRPIFIYRKFLFILVKLFVKHTDYFICQSKSGLLDFRNVFKPKKTAKIDFIYNGIDLKNAKKLSNKKIDQDDQLLFDNHKFKIISVGRFAQQKDFFTLIKAFKLVQNKFTKSKLFLIGGGELKPKIENLIKNLDLKDSVLLLGWKNNIYPYLKRANLFVFSSKYEGFPFSLIEAMSQKLPIVSTETKFGPSEILDNGKYGILVSIGDHEKMAQEIIRLIKNKPLRYKYANMAYQRVKYYSEAKMIKKYEKFLSNIKK